MSQEKVDVVRRMFGAFNRGDVDAVIATFDEGCVLEEPREMPDRPSLGFRGHDGIRDWMANLRGVAGVRFEPRSFTTSGEVVVSELASHGLGQESGVPMEWTSFAVLHVCEGKIARAQAFLRRDEALEAAGLSENVEVAARYSDAFQRGDLAAALSVLDEDVEWHDQAAIPGADVHRGREAVGRHIRQWLEAWEEIDYTPEEVLDQGNHVVVVVRRRGKGKGSGVEVNDQVAYVLTVSSDKITRFEGFSNKAEALEAAGLAE